MQIEFRPCPRCRNLRSVRIDRTLHLSHCFNCGCQWSDQDPLGSRQRSGVSSAERHVPSEAFPFTDAELKRLRAYRAAVRAGLFSDQVDRLSTRLRDARLARGGSGGGPVLETWRSRDSQS